MRGRETAAKRNSLRKRGIEIANELYVWGWGERGTGTGKEVGKQDKQMSEHTHEHRKQTPRQSKHTGKGGKLFGEGVWVIEWTVRHCWRSSSSVGRRRRIRNIIIVEVEIVQCSQWRWSRLRRI